MSTVLSYIARSSVLHRRICQTADEVAVAPRLRIFFCWSLHLLSCFLTPMHHRARVPISISALMKSIRNPYFHARPCVSYFLFRILKAESANGISKVWSDLSTSYISGMRFEVWLTQPYLDEHTGLTMGKSCHRNSRGRPCTACTGNQAS
ncbi:hypothetical protein EJ06DRAFT_54633 [Trichodelitschia bisporula]|uniref:Uncharacterized protein n=1 Tax=Trichodelitschia bisporula TaxID=703511 RepID=A0A6G1HTX7_9PEZI|nr:hypothetical protein EJ06DRAFT_54633 [Trichodelitschia bisporula]